MYIRHMVNIYYALYERFDVISQLIDNYIHADFLNHYAFTESYFAQYLPINTYKATGNDIFTHQCT